MKSLPGAGRDVLPVGRPPDSSAASSSRISACSGSVSWNSSTKMCVSRRCRSAAHLALGRARGRARAAAGRRSRARRRASSAPRSDRPSPAAPAAGAPPGRRRPRGRRPPASVSSSACAASDCVARHPALVVALVPLARAREAPLAEQIDQRRLERVVVAGRDTLARADVVAQPPERPEVGVRACRRRSSTWRAVRGDACTRATSASIAAVPVERAPLPRCPEVAPVGELPARPSEPVDRVAVERAPAQRAPEPFRRSLELLGQPGVEGAAVERLGLRLRQHLEARVHSRLDGPLVQQVVAEAVDRADARHLERVERRHPRARLRLLDARVREVQAPVRGSDGEPQQEALAMGPVVLRRERRAVAPVGTSRSRRSASSRIGSSRGFCGNIRSASPGRKTTSKLRPRACSTVPTKTRP